jgi:palmitoyltransferase
VIFVDKKLLVTCLQHTHNWTMGNDRFKMMFWFTMLFDNDLRNDSIHELPPDDLDVGKVHDEVENWLFRHSGIDSLAADLLDAYDADVPTGHTAGPLPETPAMNDRGPVEESTTPVWRADLTDKYEQDRLYARVSHEIDVWWKKVRDANYDGWVITMESVEGAMERAESCKQNAMHRYIPQAQEHDHQYEHDENYEHGPDDGDSVAAEIDDRSIQEDNGEDDEGEEEEEEDDDDSYVEGPLRGLLTEIPNILDTKQIEALHMTVKACIVDSMGSGLTPAGENLQKTRCKMFLALDCGKNLLREMLVFIAVWEQTDQQFIFQITAQIIESFHHNALLPYAWNSLRILKDIVSPAQTVLLRLINYMFRARKDSPIYDDVKDYNRDAKLIHFLYNYFRCRVVPDCIALIWAQAEIRKGTSHPSDFPVDLWDMERAKDGLSQYLDFISVIAEIHEMRHLLIEWECVYELVSLLKALEAGVARKPLDERTVPGPSRRPGATGSPGPTPNVERPYDEHGNNGSPHPHPANLPPMHDTPHKFPWSGVKIQILIILTSLIAPVNARRNGPGNPIVQKQLLDRGGIMPLLNCCVYDGHNEYLKERATLAIKFVMEGSEEAQKFVRDLVPVKQAQAQAQARAQAENRQKTASSNAGKGVHLAAEALAADLARTAASTAASFKSGQDESLQRALADVKIGDEKNGDNNAQAKANGSGGGKGKGKAKK